LNNNSKKNVAVVNQKGGVGKTTTSINLSSGLALAGKRVLLVDMDPQAHSTIGLGLEPGSYEKALDDVFAQKASLGETILETQVKNLFIAPSRIHLDRTEQELSTALFRESLLAKAISDLNFDFIIIDCRPTLGTLTINAIFASTFIVVPCEMSRYSLDGFADLMETIDVVKGRSLDKREFVRILLTKFDARNKVSNEWVMTQLNGGFSEFLFNTKIRKNEALNQAHMAMEPIFSFKADSAGAEDYDQLTKELLSLCQ
jgi:chromosome partitioning protein